jgi:hypothetical protein
MTSGGHEGIQGWPTADNTEGVTQGATIINSGENNVNGALH